MGGTGLLSTLLCNAILYMHRLGAHIFTAQEAALTLTL
jgi:hypothetical protein